MQKKIGTNAKILQDFNYSRKLVRVLGEKSAS